MRLTELLAAEPLLEMAYSQKKAESIITGLEKPLNDHLLKIWTMPGADQQSHWLIELANWIDEIGEIVLKPTNRRPNAAFYYRILFDEPFGGVELPNITSRLKRLQRQGYTLNTDASPSELVERLRRFHEAFATQAAIAPLSEDRLRNLLGTTISEQ